MSRVLSRRIISNSPIPAGGGFICCVAQESLRNHPIPAGEDSFVWFYGSKTKINTSTGRMRTVSRILSRRIIYLVPALPPDPAANPRASAGKASSALCLALLRMGFVSVPGVAARDGELLPHLFTLTRRRSRRRGGLFSVTLSCSPVRRGKIPVGDHPSLWSPDFPPLSLRKGAILHPHPADALPLYQEIRSFDRGCCAAGQSRAGPHRKFDCSSAFFLII